MRRLLPTTHNPLLRPTLTRPLLPLQMLNATCTMVISTSSLAHSRGTALPLIQEDQGAKTPQLLLKRSMLTQQPFTSSLLPQQPFTSSLLPQQPLKTMLALNMGVALLLMQM